MFLAQTAKVARSSCELLLLYLLRRSFGHNRHSCSMSHTFYEYMYLVLMLQRAVMAVIVWQLDLQLPIQSVPITTKVVSSNLVHGDVYSIQHYVIKFISDLRQVGGFLWFLPRIKLTAMHDITEILLKVALNNINQTINPYVTVLNFWCMTPH